MLEKDILLAVWNFLDNVEIEIDKNRIRIFSDRNLVLEIIHPKPTVVIYPEIFSMLRSIDVSRLVDEIYKILRRYYVLTAGGESNY